MVFTKLLQVSYCSFQRFNLSRGGNGLSLKILRECIVKKMSETKLKSKAYFHRLQKERGVKIESAEFLHVF
jgi:hypothetical protein